MSTGFLGRWARKKSLQDEINRRVQPHHQSPEPAALDAPVTAVTPASCSESASTEAPASAVPTVQQSLSASGGEASPPLTMADVEAVPIGGDVSRFMGLDVPDDVRSAALQRLFSAPEYNVRSQMDVYWEDYSNLPKLNQEEVRSLVQAKSLFLFEDPPWKAESSETETAGRSETISQLDASHETIAQGDSAQSVRSDEIRDSKIQEHQALEHQAPENQARETQAQTTQAQEMASPQAPSAGEPNHDPPSMKGSA